MRVVCPLRGRPKSPKMKENYRKNFKHLIKHQGEKLRIYTLDDFSKWVAKVLFLKISCVLTATALLSAVQNLW